MLTKNDLESGLKVLEEEYRFWLVESIQMERGIETMEEELKRHNHALGLTHAAELQWHLARIRKKHLLLDEKIRHIRQRLNNLRTRLEEMT